MNKVISHPNNQLRQSEEASLSRRSVRFIKAGTSEDNRSLNFGSESLHLPYLVPLPEQSSHTTDEALEGKAIKKIAPGLLRRFVPYESPRAIDVSHQWECVVTGISDCGETIDVDLYDLLDNERSVEYGSFDIREIPPSDRPKVEVGAILYWAIGYVNRDGTHRRVSEIRLKRMPRITRMMAQELRKRSTELANDFGVSPE